MSKWAPNASERAFLDATIARCLDALKGKLTDRQTFAAELRKVMDDLDRSPATFPIVASCEYFVDGEKFDHQKGPLTGEMIKLRLHESKRAYALFMEGDGDLPDRMINDDSTVQIPARFYTVPPATAGCCFDSTRRNLP